MHDAKFRGRAWRSLFGNDGIRTLTAVVLVVDISQGDGAH